MIETMQIIELTMKIITTINKIMTVIIDVHQVMKFPAGATKPSLGKETIKSLKSNILGNLLVIFHQHYHHNHKTQHLIVQFLVRSLSPALVLASFANQLQLR